MKKITKNQKGADFEIEVVDNRMEIRLANDFRKRIKDIRKRDPVNGPKSLLPESFQITGTPGISEPLQIKGEMFVPGTSWRTFLDVDDLPDQLSTDLSGYTISYMFIPPKEGYIYWDRDTGNIKNVSPHPLENTEMENPFVVPLKIATSFLSGEKSRKNYYIGPTGKGKLELKEKAPDFAMITDVARLSNLCEVLEGTLSPDIELSWNRKEKELNIRLLAEIVPYHKYWLNFYITKRDDPYYLFETLKVQVAELIQSENREVKREIDTDRDISIYTNLIFDHYGLVRKNA